MARFFIEIDVPADSPTISYTTDPLEQCAAIATEVAGHPLVGGDCTVYTLDNLVLQLQDEGLAQVPVTLSPVAQGLQALYAPAPPKRPRRPTRCGDTQTDTDHTYVCTRPAGHLGPHTMLTHPLHPTWGDRP